MNAVLHSWNDPAVARTMAIDQARKKAVDRAVRRDAPGKAPEFRAENDRNTVVEGLREAAFQKGQQPHEPEPDTETVIITEIFDDPPSLPAESYEVEEEQDHPPAAEPETDSRIPGIFVADDDPVASAATEPAQDEAEQNPGEVPQVEADPSHADRPAKGTRPVLFAVRRPSFLDDKRQLRALLSIVVVLGVLFLGLYSYWGNGRAPQTGSVAAPPKLDATPTGEIQQTSPDYRETLETANDSGSEAARSTGGSFLPTIEQLAVDINAAPPSGLEEEVVADVDSAPPPGTLWTTAAKVAEQIGGSPPEPLDYSTLADPFALPATPVAPLTNPMVDYLAALAERPVPRMGGQSFAAAESPAPETTGPPVAGVAGPPAPTASSATGIRPGDLLHAEMLHTLNSDLPGPAIAEIVQGRWRGARLSGSFEPKFAEGGLALRFTTLSLPDGRVLPVDAYGLSPWTGQALTRSKLEPRLLARYGPSVLGGLLSGAAAAAAAGGQRLVVVGDNLAVERDRPGEREILAAGVSSALGAIQQSQSAAAPTVPRILLEAGSPIVILFANTGVAGGQPAPPLPAAGNGQSLFPGASLLELPVPDLVPATQ